MKRTVSGAHYGVNSWLMQRVTAAIMAAFSVLFPIVVISIHHFDFFSWKALFSHVWMKIALSLFFLSIFLHAWVGMRDILMDYIHATGMRLLLMVFVVLSLVALMIWAAAIVWGR